MSNQMNVTIEASDNGETFELTWALSLLEKYGFDTPEKAGLANEDVRWLMGTEAAELWNEEKSSGNPALADWTDELPYISWTF